MKVLLIGGAGFIGSHFIDYLLSKRAAQQVIVYDNLSAGRRWHLDPYTSDQRVRIIIKDVYDSDLLDAASGCDLAIHLAANRDIPRVITEPEIDLRQGTALTQLVLEAVRKSGCPALLYASSSGVYGNAAAQWVSEHYGPLEPISTYGASKLACEALISAYCHMFGLRASAFRFGNVVGGRQTHGVAYDFLRKLLVDSTRLEILGDGAQSKPYVFVDDVIKAMMLAYDKQTKCYDVYNVAPSNFVTVREIAEIVLKELSLPREKCEFRFTGGDRGWIGDVPIVRLICDKIHALEWRCLHTSVEAVQFAVRAMLRDADKLFTDA
jgi:UDP-glucose 4-epimerase